MKIKFDKKVSGTDGLLILPVFHESSKKYPENFPQAYKKIYMDRVNGKEFEGKWEEKFIAYFSEKNLPSKVLFVGAGMLEKYSDRNARRLGGKIGKFIKQNKDSNISIVMTPEIMAFIEEFFEGLLMGQYVVEKFKTKDLKKSKDIKEYSLNEVRFISDKFPKDFEKKISRAKLINDAVDFVRDLVNFPSNHVTHEYLVARGREIGNENGYKIAVFGEKELKKMKWGGLLAVNQGAKKEAKCLILQYEGGKSSERPYIFVGKGLVFDAGGYNLKPSGHIEEMHQDMAGLAVVLGLFKVLRKLGIKKNVIGVMPIAENLVSEKALKPSDIIKMYNGKTVEITNTDAEGRVVLSDALTYAVGFKPGAIISVATLTGAVMAALGNRYSGILGNNMELCEKIKKAGDETDDLGWILPIHRDYKKKMDSKIADLRNYDNGSGKYAGTAKGAAFLERFVENYPWAHLDIGGTAFTEDPKDYETLGATAHSLRGLIRFLENE